MQGIRGQLGLTCFWLHFLKTLLKEVSLQKKGTDIKNFIALSILYLKDS